jgi:hypothetical protein
VTRTRSLLAVGSALAIVACGSSSNSSSRGSNSYSQGVRYSDCMRAHGVSNFPDPTFANVGTAADIPPDWNPEAPVSITARKACARVGIATPGAGVAWFGPVG